MSSPYIVTIEQVGANVVATGSGAIDLTNVGVLALGGGSHIPEVNPSFEIIKTGPWASSFTEYQAPLITGPSSSFGSGGDTAANSGSGDFVGIIGVNGDLYVPYGYISDNPLSDSAIYYNATFASLGVTPGTYVWTWGTGADQSFTIQIVATTPPNITITQKLTNDTGFSHTDLMTSDGHVTLSGTVSDVAGVANVEVFDGKADLGPATISNGAWMFSTLLSEGTHSLYAVAADNVGLTTTTPTQPTIVVDTTPPTPFMSDAIKNSNNSLTTLSGMSEANSTVSVFDGTKPLGTVTADSSGDWSLQANISGGTHQFTETSTDVAGNTGASAGVTDYAPGGNKTLTGGSGNDFLIGGKNDTLVGGAGNDTFVFNQGFGKETVADFNVNQDALAFDHTLFAHDTAAQVLSQAHDTSAGAVIVADAHDTVTLNGVTVAQLQAAQMAHLNWIHFV
jgi:Ca2+-binding RTX toxin-like protein